MARNVTSLSELKTAFDELLSANSIFRGVNSKTQLLPKLVRDNDYSKKEYAMLKAFERYYGLYSTANNCWEFIALAQHCGLMTRLIDFTNNPYVALFFSLHNKKEDGEEYMIYALEQKNCKVIYDTVINDPVYNPHTGTLTLEKALFEIDASYCDILKSEFEKLKKKSAVYIVKPNYRNQRMLMQQGLFVVPTKAAKNSIIDTIYKNAEVLVIGDEIRDAALSYLEKLGYDEFHLMPDLVSVCSEINHKVSSNDKR